MKLLGNSIWFVFGGFLIALEYFIASIILYITIIGIPFAFQTLKLTELALWPFGKKVIEREKNIGCGYTLINVIWILIGGIWICLSHLIFGIFFLTALIGYPFAIQHFKLAGLAFTPFGKEVVDE